MRMSVVLYERMLGHRLARTLAAAIFWILARWERLVRRNCYRELSSLLRAWRSLASVAPGTVPSCIIGNARDRIADLARAEVRSAFIDAFRQENIARAWYTTFARFALDQRIRMQYPRNDDDPQRQGDLMILKPPLPDGEKGVIMVMYSPSIAKLAALYDHERLARRYRFVLEPSTWGYQDPDLLLFLHLETEVFVQSQYGPDFEHIRSLGHNLIPLRVGAGDWVDPARFTVTGQPTKNYDVVMVASWLKLKRHALFFAALRELGDRISRVALVGVPSGGRVRADVAAEARSAGVFDKIVWFEDISHQKVSDVIQQSRVSLMLSTREGASRAIYESLFCNVPVILTDRNIGVNRDHINDRTGIVSGDDELAGAITNVLAYPERFAPRAWALAHTGYSNATRLLQEGLQQAAARSGEPWTMNILPKVNAPNLRYVTTVDWRLAQAWYADLSPYLRLL